MQKTAPCLIVALVLTGCGGEKANAGPDAAAEGAARADVRVAGSLTIYPFAEKVREAFQAEGGAPVTVESTGSGAGRKRFCQGLGMDTPDIVNSSRAQTGNERQTCVINGVDEILEIPFGFDGIVVAQSRFAEPIEFSIDDFYQAFAKTLPASDDETARRGQIPTRNGRT
jgi:phosphate transport system substrate-binding protein